MRFPKQLLFVLLLVSTLTSFAQTGKYEWKEATSGGFTYKYVNQRSGKSKILHIKKWAYCNFKSYQQRPTHTMLCGYKSG